MLEAREYDELIRAANPLTSQRSDAEIDAALGRLLRKLPAADARRTQRWGSSRTRLALAGSPLAAAIVVAFLVTNLAPTSGTPGGVSNAWAKQVIARVAAVMSGSGHGILHIDETVTQNLTDGEGTRHYSSGWESWQQQTPPYNYWQTTHGHYGNQTTTIINRRIERYDPESNTLYKTQMLLPPSEVLADETEENPAWEAVARLLHHGVPVKASYGELIAQLLKTGGVTIDLHARLHGGAAIRITRKMGDVVTLYVQPATYEPLEYVISGGRSGPYTRFTVSTRFSAYQTLTAGSMSPPNLQQLHPQARITRSSEPN